MKATSDCFDIELSQSFYFEAAHTLHREIESEGSRRIHGHTYEALVTVGGVIDDDTGMVVDLAHLKAETQRIRNLLDHQFLDDIKEIGIPTMENLCLYIIRQFDSSKTQLKRVSIKRRASGDECTVVCRRRQ